MGYIPYGGIVPRFFVIASLRQQAWQSPGSIRKNAQQLQRLYREIAASLRSSQ